MTEIIIIAIFCLIVIGINYYEKKKFSETLGKSYESMFREFVIAEKSKNLDEYNYSVPSEGELPQQEVMEFVQIEDVPHGTLLKAMKEYEGK